MFKLFKNPLVIFAIISLLLVLPYLPGKYILTLDTVAGPNKWHGPSNIEDFIYGTYVNDPNRNNLTIDAARIPLFLLSIFLRIFFPVFWLQKLELFLFFFIAMWGMFRLIQTKSLIPRYFAAFLFAINPFVYFRLMSGQWLILLGYMILPFLLYELVHYKKKRPFHIALWITLIAMLNTHTLALAIITTAFFFSFKEVKNFFIIGISFVMLNVYWLIPTITASSTTITTIGFTDVLAFETQSSFINVVLSVAMMHGFWRQEAYNLMPLWYLLPLFAIILFLAIHGFLHSKAPHKTRIAILGLFAFVMALGTSYTPTAQFFVTIFENIPLMRGFREPHKFVALLAFVYAYLGAYGLQHLNWKKARAIALLIPFAFTPFLVFNTQLTPVDYPKDYYEVNDFLNNDQDEFTTLFLPWHLYFDLNFIQNQDKRIANPSSVFFDKPIIRSENVDLQPLTDDQQQPLHTFIAANLNESAEALTAANVKYIIIAKEFDQDYKDTSLVLETDTLKVLQNNFQTSKVMQSNDFITFTPLSYQKISPLRYEIEATDAQFILFAEPYNQDWLLGDQKPLENMPVNVYENNNDTLLHNNVWIRYLLGFGISSLTLFGLLYILMVRKHNAQRRRK